MPMSATPPAPAKAPATFAMSAVVRERPIAPISISGRMVWPMSTLRIAWSEGRARPGDAVDHEHVPGLEQLGEDEEREDGREHRIAAARQAHEGAQADPVARHAEKRRQHGAGPHQRAEGDEPLDRAGRGQDVPAEDQRFHLEADRGGQVRRPLEAEAADGKGGESRGQGF